MNVRTFTQDLLNYSVQTMLDYTTYFPIIKKQYEAATEQIAEFVKTLNDSLRYVEQYFDGNTILWLLDFKTTKLVRNALKELNRLITKVAEGEEIDLDAYIKSNDALKAIALKTESVFSSEAGYAKAKGRYFLPEYNEITGEKTMYDPLMFVLTNSAYTEDNEALESLDSTNIEHMGNKLVFEFVKNEEGFLVPKPVFLISATTDTTTSAKIEHVYYDSVHDPNHVRCKVLLTNNETGEQYEDIVNLEVTTPITCYGRMLVEEVSKWADVRDPAHVLWFNEDTWEYVDIAVPNEAAFVAAIAEHVKLYQASTLHGTWATGVGNCTIVDRDPIGDAKLLYLYDPTYAWEQHMEDEMPYPITCSLNSFWRGRWAHGKYGTVGDINRLQHIQMIDDHDWTHNFVNEVKTFDKLVNDLDVNAILDACPSIYEIEGLKDEPMSSAYDAARKKVYLILNLLAVRYEMIRVFHRQLDEIRKKGLKI